MNKTDAKRVTLPMVMDRLKAETTSSKIKEQEPRPNSVLFVRRTHNNEASTSKASVIQANKHPTLPRRAYKQKSTPYSDVKKRWVPKAVLEAQGYYHGTQQLWVPKQQPSPPTTTPKQTQGKRGTIPCAPTTKPTQYWRPKTPIKTKVTKEPNRPMLTKQTRKVWVPKHKQPRITTTEEHSSKVAHTIQQPVPTHANLGKKSRYPTIKDRARVLQIKLFGLRSLPTI